MKATLSTAILSAILMVSCAKSDHGVNPYFTGIISAYIDGNLVTFNNLASAVVINQNGNYSFNLAGYSSAAGSNRIACSIASKTRAIGVDVYNDSITNNNYTLSFGYQEQPNNVSYASGTNPYYASVAISSVSSTEVKGTFSGTVATLNGSGSPIIHAFTNGKFDMPLNR
jgi:hypothetical protein